MNDLFLSFILGLIQGLTEFLPISSSAHLLFPSLIFGTSDLGLAFDIAVHAGTLCAVLYYFRQEILLMLKSFILPQNNLRDERRLAFLLILATLPIVVMGVLGKDFIELNRSNIANIAYANIAFAALLYFAYKFNTASKTLIELSIMGALFIGLFQVFALLPGASRSGTAITAALFIGLNLKDASRFAFLLSIPTILGAIILLIGDLISNSANLNLLYLIVGFFTSGIFAFMTIKYFLIFVNKIGMYPFVIYRFALGLVILLII